MRRQQQAEGFFDSQAALAFFHLSHVRDSGKARVVATVCVLKTRPKPAPSKVEG